MDKHDGNAVGIEPLKCSHCGRSEGEPFVWYCLEQGFIHGKITVRPTPDTVDGFRVYSCSRCDWVDETDQLFHGE